MRPLFTLLLLAAALPARAGGLVDLGGKSIDDYTLSLRGRAWTSEQNSLVQSSEDLQPGSAIDFFDDTDLDDRLFMPWAEAELRFDELALRFDAWWGSDSKRGEFLESEGFDGHVFLDGDRALFRFTTIQGSGHFEWIPLDFGSSKTIGLEVGFLLGARITRMEAYIRDSASGESYRSSTVGWGPDPGLSVSVGLLNFMELEARVCGMQFRLGTYDYRAIDAWAELRFFIDDHFYVGLGYRYNYTSVERGDADDDGRLLEFLYHGPSVALGLQF
ncbi:MAG: hypothetical protein IT452_20645 [Planctomycetia bacterium]|nr:hypothetical protein [Planctomycetia bacterium]